jgi:hypothetical protein
MASGGAIAFLIFYSIFLGLTVYFTGLMDFSQILTVDNPQVLTPTTDFFTAIGKFFYLATASTLPEFQILGAILFGFGIGVFYIIVKALPFT